MATRATPSRGTDLTLSGNLTAATLTVSGAQTFTGTGAFTGAVTVGTTLGVTGASTLTGGVTIGSGGAAVTKVLRGTNATLNFAEIAAGEVGTGTITVTGAAAGNAVFLSAPAAIEAGLVWCGFVSAANTVTVRLFNGTAAPIDPAAASWTATVIQ